MALKTLTEKQCRGAHGAICRNWDDCAGKPWYPRRNIVYCRYQMLWLIGNFLNVDGDDIILERDTWPSEGRETGYTDAPRTQKLNVSHAAYEFTLQEVGELHHRLEKTGKDGRLLILEMHVRLAYDTSPRNLSREARAALGYISGWRRKRQSFTQWKAEKRR